MGNGACNDDANTAECNYDGGDCCLIPVNTELCSACTCHLQQTCLDGVHPLVGDGYCHDELNNLDCTYDGGDCCGSNVAIDYCTECACYGKEIFIIICYCYSSN